MKRYIFGKLIILEKTSPRGSFVPLQNKLLTLCSGNVVTLSIPKSFAGWCKEEHIQPWFWHHLFSIQIRRPLILKLASVGRKKKKREDFSSEEERQLIITSSHSKGSIKVTLDFSFAYKQSCYSSSIKTVLQNMMTKNHIAEVPFLPVHSKRLNCWFLAKTIHASFWGHSAQPARAFRNEPPTAFPSSLPNPPTLTYTSKVMHGKKNKSIGWKLQEFCSNNAFKKISWVVMMASLPAS